MKHDNRHSTIEFSLGDYPNILYPAISRFKQEDILNRIFNHDYTVWKSTPKEISNRLGWLNIMNEFTQAKITEMECLRDNLIRDDYRQAILLGMGGSSLAPELFSLTFPTKNQANPALSLSILDSTCPQSVHDISTSIDLNQTLFIVSTKSGTTEETLSFFKYFYRLLIHHSMKDVGDHFVAITDPGSQLEAIAKKLHFRHIFLNNPNLGGRYSALSHFGLIPATLCGADISMLLKRVQNMAQVCRQHKNLEDNPAVMLGLILGELAKSGCDKVTFIASPTLQPFCDWLEQLIAESTGKEGKGILPVVGEPAGDLYNYSKDRLFVILELADEEMDTNNRILKGFPHIIIHLQDIFDLGEQFFLWEMATAIVGHSLKINPFDQPNVEATKKNVRTLVDAFKNSGVMPSENPIFTERGISVFGDIIASSIKECLATFINQFQPGDYFALQAFLYPQNTTRNQLQDFRATLRDKTKLATTLGFGPRFLHSTGQLHKGDRGNGLFIQFTSNFPQDVPIPDTTDTDTSSLTFGTLIHAQAMGDLLALKQAGRRVLRFHIDDDPSAAMAYLNQILKSI